jgi:hypothetical protein
VVCIPQGAKTPFVLRRDWSIWGGGGGEETFRLYGEAYLHSFMDGQVLGKRIEHRWFDLR